MNVRPNGIGGTTGDQLATCAPLQLVGAVWYVGNNVTGAADAASPAGKDREKPLLTIGQAHTNAAAGDIIVLMDGHDETLTATLTLSKIGIDIVGEGQSSGLPTAKLRINAANLSLLNLTATSIRLRNIRFPASVQSNVGPGANVGKIHVAAAALRTGLYGCYIEQGAFDQLPGVSVATASGDLRIFNSTIISTAPTSVTRPTYGLFTVGTHTELEVIGTTFSDGPCGFSGAAWDSTAGIITRLYGLGISALLGADILINSASTGWMNVQEATGGGRLEW